MVVTSGRIDKTTYTVPFIRNLRHQEPLRRAFQASHMRQAQQGKIMLH